MRVYLAGPMRSKPKFNVPLFRRVANMLREAGVDVVSPVELDEAEGIDVENFDPKDLTEAFVAEIIARDVKAILECDGIVMLPDWEWSKGAKAELAVAEWAGKRTWMDVGELVLATVREDWEANHAVA